MPTTCKFSILTLKIVCQTQTLCSCKKKRVIHFFLSLCTPWMYYINGVHRNVRSLSATVVMSMHACTRIRSGYDDVLSRTLRVPSALYFTRGCILPGLEKNCKTARRHGTQKSLQRISAE